MRDWIDSHLRRPLMYGGSAAGVDLVLHQSLELWAFGTEHDEEFYKEFQNALKQESCGSSSFSTRYIYDHPESPEQDVVHYLVRQWRRIADALAIANLD